MKNVAYVFDLDKTIGYFTQLAIFMESIEDFIGRELKIKEFFNLVDLFPKIFRPDIFPIFRYLKELKQKHKYVKVLIYTNNMGPKRWVHRIRKYIEYKLDYKLFDRTIAAWKVGNTVYEKCRTSHGKSVSDIIRCSSLKKGDKICFLDDQQHPKMMHRSVDYLFLYQYKYDYNFEKMIEKFLNSNLSKLIKKEKRNEFKTDAITFSKTSPYGFKYIESVEKNPINYNKKEIIDYLKEFFKTNKRYTITKNRKSKRKTQRRKK